MFNNTIKEIKDTQVNLIATEAVIKEASSLRDRLTKQLSSARQKLARKKDPKVGTNTAASIIKGLKAGNELETILITEISDAANRRSLEFSNTGYLEPLYKVAKEKSIYKLIPVGSGWTVTISPQIVFESEAGDLNDWARGVTAFRDKLKTKQAEKGKRGSKTKGKRATVWWLNNVYGSGGLMKKTVLSRVGLSGRPDGAPFWQLLNNGTTSLASDRTDGSFIAISQAPTAFIKEAEIAIKKLFDTTLRLNMSEWLSETQQFEKEIEKATKFRDSFSDVVKQLRLDAKQNRAILQKLGPIRQYIDEDKLAVVAHKLRAGEEFTTKTVNLTKKGASRKAILTIARVEGLID